MITIMKRIIFILAAPLIISSCRKDSVAIPAGNISHRIIRVNNLSFPENNADITYDAKDRVLTVTDSTQTVTYEYLGNTVKYSDFSKTNNAMRREGIITLNNRGCAASCDLTEYTTPNVPKWANYTYEYNADGNCTKSIRHSQTGDGEIWAEYQGGNMVKQTFFTNGVMNSYWVYTYGAFEDTRGITSMFIDVTESLGGIWNKNLWSKAEQFSPANVKMSETTFDYEFNSAGKIVKYTTHNMPSNASYSYSYEYSK